MICTYCGGLTQFQGSEVVVGRKYYIYKCRECGKTCRKLLKEDARIWAPG